MPPGLRLIEPGDRRGVLDLFLLAHQENGWGGVDLESVEHAIDSAIWRNGDVIAVIPGRERIEATIGLRLSKLWYGTDKDWFWTELLVYVHPEHRRSRHAEKLLAFASWWSDAAGQPVFINVQPRADLARKSRFFGRFAKLCGATFQFGVKAV